MSKIKNPDRYIKALKNRNEDYERYLQSERKANDKAWGKDWFKYSDNITQNVVLSQDKARKFHLGDEVIVRGKIISFIPSKTEPGRFDVTFTLEEVRANNIDEE